MSTRNLFDEAVRQSIREDRLYRFSRFLPSRKALAVLTWLVICLGLAFIAFGSRPFVNGGSVLAALVHAHGTFRVVAFVALGLLVLFGLLWLWGEISSRHMMGDIGIFMSCAGIVGFLLLLGQYVLSIHLLGTGASVLVGVFSFVLFVRGADIMSEYPSRPPLPAPPPPRRSRYHRKAVTTYGDARPADDFEIDESLRDKSGGFDPMFKD